MTNMDQNAQRMGGDSGSLPARQASSAIDATLEIGGQVSVLRMGLFFRVTGAPGIGVASLVLKRAGGAYYGTLSAERQLFERDVRALASNTVDGILAILILAGRIEAATSNGTVVAEAGEIVILAMSETMSLETIDCRAQICLLPLAMIATDGYHGSAWHGHVFRRHSRLTELLAATIASVVGYYRQPAPLGAENLSQPLAAMLGRCLTDAIAAGGGGLPVHSAGVIIRFIHANLGDPGLSVASLAKQFGMARASLYRQFRSVGGVAEYIRKQRLQRARLELARSGGGPVHLAKLAARLGFKSAEQFSRAFHAMYGVSPRTFRQESAAEGRMDRARD